MHPDQKQDDGRLDEHRQRIVTMKRTPSTLVLCLAVLTILNGCAGRVRYPRYYTLNVATPPDPPAPQNAHATLAVREFRAPAYLHQGAIVYRTSPEQIGFYAYHRWAVDPRDSVTNSIMDQLRASGAFGRVEAYRGSSDIEYVLSGRLEKLEELDYQSGVKVQVAISAQVTSVSTGSTLWANSVSEIGDVKERDVPAIVSQMNLTMQRAIEKLVTPLSAGWADGSISARKD